MDPDPDLETALHAAQKAVEFDKNEQYKQASYYYGVAISLLKKFPNVSGAPERLNIYLERIRELDKIIADEETNKSIFDPSTKNNDLHRCKYLLNEALDADEAGMKLEAIELYTSAAEIGLKAKSLAKSNNEKSKITNLVMHALDRAESLKGIKRIQKDSSIPELPDVPDTEISLDDVVTKTSNLNIGPPISSKAAPSVVPKKSPLHRGSSGHLKITGGSFNYSEEEKKVLLYSSHINDHEFVPFMEVDLSERFQYAIPFTDKDGYLELAPKQRPDFDRWARPEELFAEPKIIMGRIVDYFSIKQTVVSDCSFVASLAVSAQYEKKFGRRLITSIIYPKNKNREPIYNPFGKYMVKLHINGIPRKVVIDDLLPVSRQSRLLCSYSSNRGELWISLLEKAYMKVMGGYDFPGSNSNIDLHALTGWIPERWAIKSSESSFNKDSVFNTLLLRLQKGDVLVTVATGDLSDSDADRTGLVSSHAYAVLDVKKVDEVRLLQLKNPWSHLRWKGNYSELDRTHWTKDMMETLHYDPDSASQFDNGVFWIDYDSICHFFEVFYLNWNPKLFSYTYCYHQMWNAGIGPVKDAYNIGDNPQFSLETQADVMGAVWILLTRHITDIADFRQNQEYITVLVYQNNGKRVYYPHDPPPYIDGIRINSPHYLCKIKLDKTSERRYTLVISQYEKTNTIYYTLRVYATCPFTLKKITDPYKFVKEIMDGQWKGVTAGGCANNLETYMNNPRYQLVLDNANNNNFLLIILKGPKQYQIGFELLAVVLIDPEAPTAFKSKHSGPFRSGFVYLELEDVPSGTYNIIPSTFLPNQEGPFFLIVKSSCNIQVTPM